MTFRCLVSSSAARRPLPMQVEADDEMCAAHACWLARGLTGRPYVHIRPDDKYVVTDGFNVVKVTILSKS